MRISKRQPTVLLQAFAITSLFACGKPNGDGAQRDGNKTNIISSDGSSDGPIVDDSEPEAGAAEAGAETGPANDPPSSTQVVVYPDPIGLENTTNLAKSDLYSVTVNGTPTFVYRSHNREPKLSAIQNAHFAYFSFHGGPVTISATKLSGSIKTAKVRPLSLGIAPTVVDNTLTFDLATPRKFLIQIDGDSDPLILLADAPDSDVPSATDPNVVRFAAGFHDIGRNYEIKDNQTVYIEGGAVVKGTFGFSATTNPSTTIRQNVALRGRGIVYAGDYPWPGSGSDAYGKYGIFHESLNNSRIEGIIALDSEYWNFGTKNTSTMFENIKIIAWAKNTDGIWVGPNSTARDCFIMTNDDSIRPATVPTFPDSSSTLIENMVVWHESYGRPFYIPNYYDVQNITYRNIEYIRSEHSFAAQSYMPTFIGSGLPRKIRNITFENITFEEIVTPSGTPNKGNFFSWTVSPKSSIENIRFVNVHAPISGGTISGLSDTERVRGVVFDGFYRGGQKMTSLTDMGITINSYVDGVVFQ